jgi:phosphoribosylaminoimidazole (AIR) synthetase
MTGPENGDKNREFKLFKPYIAMAQSYEKAGVNLEAGYEVVRRIKKHVASTSRLGVMGNIGAFGGMFDLSALKVNRCS